MATFAAIPDAVAAIAMGRPVVVVDDEHRENEGDLVFAAQFATPELVAFMMTECRGLICVPIAPETALRLELDQMAPANTESMQTAFTVSVDARDCVSTGISAADRCTTIRLLADPDARPGSLARPGHVFPLRARPGGVLERPGHTEAAVDLTRLAGLRPAGVICEIANADGTMARLPELKAFAARHELPLVTIADLVAYRRRHERLVHRVTETVLPLAQGRFRAVGYTTADVEHVALVLGDVAGRPDVLVRVHSECLTGDGFGSLRCDCGPQLRTALDLIAAEGRGVVVYLRGHEGRGIGLVQKLRAYALQDRGEDTVDANLALGVPVDARDYTAGAQILRDLRVGSVRLLTGNPAKVRALRDHGIEVRRQVPAAVAPTTDNLRYLRSKRDRMGHALSGLPWYDDDFSWAAPLVRSGRATPADHRGRVSMYGLATEDADPM